MGYKKQLTGNLMLLITALVWGLAFTAQKVAGDLLSTFFVNGFRFLLGALILIPALFFLDKIRKNGRKLFSKKNKHWIDLTSRELLSGVLCGVVLILATTLQQFGLIEASPGKASFLTALYVVFVPFFGLLRRKVASANVWISIVIALVGAYLLTSGGMDGLTLSLYDILLILSAMTFALHITVIDIFSGTVDAVRMSFVQFATAGIVCLPFLFSGILPTSDQFLAALPSLFYLGIGSCGLAYTLQTVGQQMSGTPAIASLIMSMESVFGVLGGVIILKDTMSAYQIAGCAVIFFAVVFSQLPLDVWVARVRRRPLPETVKEELPDTDKTPPSK